MSTGMVCRYQCFHIKPVYAMPVDSGNTALVPQYWNDAISHLSRHDRILESVIAQYPGETLVARGSAFYTLARSVAGQQISVAAAEAVWKRLEDTVCKIEPAHILSVDEDNLKLCGLSRQKISYLRGIAEFFLNRNNIESRWHGMSDNEVIADLTTIKGVGRWTAEMFLIFHLLRPDVLPVADLGLQKAVEKLYGNEAGAICTKSSSALSDIAVRWKPYRSVATWYLWRSLDPVAVEY